MAAGQRDQRLVQAVHGQERGAVGQARILGHQVAGRAILAVERDPVAGEVDQHAVVRPYLGRQRLGQQPYD